MKYNSSKIFLVLLFILLIFFVAKNINFNLLASNFNKRFFLGLFITQIPIAFSVVLLSVRHLLFIRKNINFFIAFNAIILSMGLNYIIPGRFSEIIKATYIKDKANISFSIGIGAIVLGRLADLIVLCIWSLLGFVVFTLTLDQKTTMTLILISIILILSIIYFEKYILLFVDRWVKVQRLKDFISEGYVHIKNQILSKRFIIGLFYTFIIWCFSLATIYIFINIAGEGDFSLASALILLIGASLGLAIPALPGGLGTFEAIVVVILMKQGYDFEFALSLAIGLRISGMFLVVPYALVIMVKNGTGIKSMLTKDNK